MGLRLQQAVERFAGRVLLLAIVLPARPGNVPKGGPVCGAHQCDDVRGRVERLEVDSARHFVCASSYLDSPGGERHCGVQSETTKVFALVNGRWRRQSLGGARSDGRLVCIQSEYLR